MNKIQSVLFDLDGTFADTAPDLAFALNTLLGEQGYPELAFETIRPHVSHGGAALIKLGFEKTPEDNEYEALRTRFLDIYLDNIARETRLFDGMEQLLIELETNNIIWGIVTNKPGWLTDPLMKALNLDLRSACTVSGDTTAHAKPHPEPLLYACSQTGVKPEHCIYVGDAERDIMAGKNAGMLTLTALFGYISESDQPETWQANAMINHPSEIMTFLKQKNADK